MQVRVGEYSIRVCPISHYSPMPRADWGIRLILSPQSLPLGQRRCGATTASKCGVDGQVRSWWQNHLRPCGETTLYPAFFLPFARLSTGCTRSCYLDYATRRNSLSDGRFYQPSFCKMQTWDGNVGEDYYALQCACANVQRSLLLCSPTLTMRL